MKMGSSSEVCRGECYKQQTEWGSTEKDAKISNLEDYENGCTDQCMMGKIVQDDPGEINTGQFPSEAMGLEKGLGFILKPNDQSTWKSQK